MWSAIPFSSPLGCPPLCQPAPFSLLSPLFLPPPLSFAAALFEPLLSCPCILKVPDRCEVFVPKALCSPQQWVSREMPNRDINYCDKMGRVPGGPGACPRLPNSFNPDPKLKLLTVAPVPKQSHSPQPHWKLLKVRRLGKNGMFWTCGRLLLFTSNYSQMRACFWHIIHSQHSYLPIPHGPFFFFSYLLLKEVTQLFLIIPQWNFNSTNILYMCICTVCIRALYNKKLGPPIPKNQLSPSCGWHSSLRMNELHFHLTLHFAWPLKLFVIILYC